MTEQEIIQIVQTWLNNNFQKTKVSQLATARSLTGLYVLGFLANGSVKAPIELLKGNAGKSVELRNNNGELQWRVEGGTWAVLYEKDELQGKDGKPFEYGDFTQEQLDLLAESVGDGLEFSANATHIQYRLQGGTWVDVVSLEILKGTKGDKGSPNTLSIGTVQSGATAGVTITGTSPNQILNFTLQKGDKGDKGDPNTLSIGTVQGGANAGASITGTAPNQTLNLTLPKGDTGANIELQKTTTHVQWRVVGGTWANLIPLSDLKGAQGDNISLQKTATHIQWRLGTGAWTNLVALTELKGDTGANIELQKSATHVQWRVAGTTTWNNLIPIDDLKVKGDTGANIELRKSTTHVQWRVVGTSTWTNLVALSELKGEKGDAPVKGVDYFDGKDPVLNIGTITTVASNAQADATVEPDGVDAGGKPKFKLNLWLPKGVDGEGAGDMLKSVYDPTGKNTDVFGYVDGKVKTDVPANAKFTDTTYENATTSVSGLMSDTDKSKLDGVEAGANKYVHPAGTNPHGTTKADVGLGNVDNTSDANKPVSTAQATAINAKYTKPALGIPKADLVTAVQTSLGKADTALQSFTETDPTVPSWAKQTNKPAYTATEVGAIPASQKGANNGVAELDSTGKVLSSQLPSYVDDVLNYATQSNFPVTGESGKIYITEDTNKTYRWTGSAYTEISPSIALGETSATAYRGDRGKTAYDHSQTAHAPSTAQKNSDITKAEIEAKLTGAITTHTHAYAPTSHTHNATDINAGTLAIARIPTGTTSSTVSLGNHTHSDYVPTSRTVAGKALTANITLAKDDVGLGNVDNTSDANKPVSTAMQTALNGKLDKSIFAGSTFTANVIPLDNPLGSFRVATASNVTTYTLSTTKVIGAWAKIRVNMDTEPSVTGAIKITGSDFEANKDMYLLVSYDGRVTEYYFAEI